MAGILFGFALQMKLIGVVYLPLAGLILWFRADAKTMSPRSREAWASLIRQFFRACLVFVPSIMITFIALNVLTGNSLLLQFQQSWAAHFADAKSFEYGSP